MFFSSFLSSLLHGIVLMSLGCRANCLLCCSLTQCMLLCATSCSCLALLAHTEQEATVTSLVWKSTFPLAPKFLPDQKKSGNEVSPGGKGPWEIPFLGRPRLQFATSLSWSSFMPPLKASSCLCLYIPIAFLVLALTLGWLHGELEQGTDFVVIAVAN